MEYSEDQGKSGNLKDTGVQKLTQVQKNIFNCCVQQLKFFLLGSLADYLYLHWTTPLKTVNTLALYKLVYYYYQ